MSQYPKRAWLLIQVVLTEEDGREVIMKEHDVPLGMTYSPAVAELVVAKMKEREGKDTMVRSGIQALPSSLLEMFDEPTTPSTLLEEIADASVQDKD